MGIWFETGNKMENGDPRTVYADGDIAIAEARKKRWKEVALDDGKTPETVQGTKIEGVTGVTTRKVGQAHDVFRNELTEDDVATAEDVVGEEIVEEVATTEEVSGGAVEEVIEEPAVEEEPAEEAPAEVEKPKRGRKKKK